MSISRRLRNATLGALLAALTPAAALAHPDHQISENLMAGLLHPLTGLDHLLMIVAVGAWTALLPPFRRVAVVGTLGLFAGFGALLPVGGGWVLELAITLTVIGSGVLLASGKRWPLWATGALVALFALIHGLAHGSEGPVERSFYVPGLMLATATLALFASLLAASLLSQRQFDSVSQAISHTIASLPLSKR